MSFSFPKITTISDHHRIMDMIMSSNATQAFNLFAISHNGIIPHCSNGEYTSINIAYFYQLISEVIVLFISGKQIFTYLRIFSTLYIRTNSSLPSIFFYFQRWICVLCPYRPTSLGLLTETRFQFELEIQYIRDTVYLFIPCQSFCFCIVFINL